MNLSILILPALLGNLAASAAHTLPADLKHDAAGKTPLTVARMAVARGAGSTCREGCNEPNVACHVVNGPDDYIEGYEKQTWIPHGECAFAFGSDTCTSMGDALCNEVDDYAADDDTCSGPTTSRDFTTSAFCNAFIPD